jgi:TonB family protein
MGVEGRALVGFDIAPTGRTTHVSIIWSENQVFESTAVEFVREIRYTVPPDWASSGALRRWRLGFVWRLFPSASAARAAAEAGPRCQSDKFAIPVAETVVITGSRLRGARGELVPPPSSKGDCLDSE